MKHGSYSYQNLESYNDTVCVAGTKRTTSNHTELMATRDFLDFARLALRNASPSAHGTYCLSQGAGSCGRQCKQSTIGCVGKPQLKISISAGSTRRCCTRARTTGTCHWGNIQKQAVHEVRRHLIQTSYRSCS